MFPQPLRNVGAAALLSAGVALTGALMGGCASQSAAPAGSAAPQPGSAAVVVTSAAPQTPAEQKLPKPPGPANPDLRCTNQYDYAADTRDNAEINSIGDTTHTCPPVKTATPNTPKEVKLPAPPGPANPDLKCTNQYDYAADTRDNAEINSIGDTTHTCPPVKTA